MQTSSTIKDWKLNLITVNTTLLYDVNHLFNLFVLITVLVESLHLLLMFTLPLSNTVDLISLSRPQTADAVCEGRGQTHLSVPRGRSVTDGK